jgi:hypothetical protein
MLFSLGSFGGLLFEERTASVNGAFIWVFPQKSVAHSKASVEGNDGQLLSFGQYHR